MAAPFTTGKNITINKTFARPVFGGGTFTESYDYDRVIGNRQKAPNDTVLGYTRQRGTMVRWRGVAGSEDQANYGFHSIYPIPNASWLDQQAYEKMRGKAFDTVEMGTNLAEYRQAHSLALGTLSTLIGVARALRQRNLSEVARRLRLRSSPRRQRVNPRRLDGYVGAERNLAELWLMYIFGVEPLVKDLYSCLEVFEQPLKALKLTGVQKSSVINWVPLNQTSSGYCGGKPQITVTKKTVIGTYRVNVGCEVRLNNPHLLFLEQSGLINPASIAWELVPFSFVADWFGNFGSVIRRMSDFAGLDVRMAYTSRKWNYQAEHNSASTGLCRTDSSNTFVSAMRFTRTAGFPAASFALKPLALPSARRIVTAFSLFSVLLPRGR